MHHPQQLGLTIELGLSEFCAPISFDRSASFITHPASKISDAHPQLTIADTHRQFIKEHAHTNPANKPKVNTKQEEKKEKDNDFVWDSNSKKEVNNGKSGKRT